MNAWNDLITAQTAGDFCTHWLRVLTDNMPNWVSAGVLLQANSEQGRAFSPIALLPKQQALDPAFNPSIEKLVNTGKPLQEQVQTAQGLVQVCMHPIFLNQTIQGVVFVAFSDLNNKTREVRDITWGLPWLVNLLSQKQFDDQHQQIDQLASLLKTVGTGLRTGPLQEVLFELLFAVRERFNAQRAVLAVRHHQSLRLKVISDSVEHDNRSQLVDKYIAALEECLDHQVLNARQDQDEASIIEQAGQTGRITIATNMAGRGTDIKLHPQVKANGGLHVILAEYNESQRIDRQLFGRAARQGDPGSVRAIVSLHDELFQTEAPLLARWHRLYIDQKNQGRYFFQCLLKHCQKRSARRSRKQRLQSIKQDKAWQESLGFVHPSRK